APAAPGLGHVLRLRLFARAGDRYRAGSPGHRDRWSMVGVETGPGTGHKLFVLDDRSFDRAGISATCRWAADSGGSAVRRHRHSTPVLCDGHDGAGDGAASDGQVLGGHSPFRHDLAGAVGYFLVFRQTRDIACALDLLRCAETEGRGLTAHRKMECGP